MNLEGTVADLTALTDELVKPFLRHGSVALRVHIDAVIIAGRGAVEGHTEAHRFTIGVGTEHIAATRGGSVCVLDMGEAILVQALAERLCRALGREPHTEIPIVETGLRPGEKLYEELLTTEEGVHSSTIDRVFIAPQQRLDFGSFETAMSRLFACCRRDDMASVVDIVAGLVPTFIPGAHWAAAQRAIA